MNVAYAKDLISRVDAEDACHQNLDVSDSASRMQTQPQGLQMPMLRQKTYADHNRPGTLGVMDNEPRGGVARVVGMHDAP